MMVYWDFYGEIKSSIFNDIWNRFKKHNKLCNMLTIQNRVDCEIIHHHRLHKSKLDLNKINIATIHYDISDFNMVKLSLDYIDKLKKLDLIICISGHQKKFIKKYLAISTPVVVINHGFESRLLAVHMKRLNYIKIKKKIFIGFVSKRYKNRQKGENLLLEISRKIDPNKFSFILIGEDRGIDEKKIKKLGFDVVTFEFLKYDCLIELYKIIDVVLILSKSEGGPACIPEALASGCKVVTKPVGMSNDIENSNLSVVNSVDDFILQLENISMHRELDLNGLYDWDFIMDKHNKIYCDLINGYHFNE